MKLSEDFVLRQVAGTWVVLPLKTDTVDFNGMIRLNDSGAVLWKALERGSNREALIRELTDRYEVTVDDAGADVDEFLNTLRKIGCVQ